MMHDLGRYNYHSRTSGDRGSSANTLASPLRLQFCPHLPFREGHRLGDTRTTEETVLRAMGCGLLTPERAEALVRMGRGLLLVDRKCVDVTGCYNRRNHRHGHIMNTR